MMLINCTGDGRRLDMLLSESCELTRSRIASLIKDGHCTVGGQTTWSPGDKVKAGAEVQL